MKVYEIGDYTKGLSLHAVERPEPAPGHGEAVMRVRATGINARDLSIMEGALGKNVMPYTRVPLSDNAGDIIAVGSGVENVEIGDRVTMTHYWEWLDGDWHADMAKKDYASTIDGFLAEQVVVPAAALIKLPDSISYEDASTIQSPGLTAWNAVVEAGAAKASDTVLTLGTGGVSVFGMQWAKMLGARVIITSSSDEKLARMTALGADMTINYRTNPDWSSEVLDLTDGEGADIILNNVGLGELENCLLSAASNGRIMHIGANPVVHNQGPQKPLAMTKIPNIILKNLTIRGIIVGSRRMFVDCLAAMEANNIKPIIDRVFDWDDIYECIEYMRSGDKLGKIVIRIP
ncbi:MAG: zinc-binding dehydrogenase [Alphaproteobacteria bacterium]|nr:zinc-binding dehydrogenase [Alphaproteobacteria bacterium]